MKREEKITITLSLKEKDELRQLADQHHLKLASFCRMRLFNSSNSYKDVPISRVKKPKNNFDPYLSEKEKSHSTFKKEVVNELSKKLSQPKPLVPIPKKELKKIKEKKKKSKLKINKELKFLKGQ